MIGENAKGFHRVYEPAAHSRQSDFRKSSGMKGVLNVLKELFPAALTLCVLQVNIVSCDGKCPSASIYNYNINTYARFCKCCRETGLQRRSVQLYCSSNSTWVSYTIQEPTDCSCQWS